VLRSPWLLWMREALRGRAIDVAHFCCHGYLSRGRGALLFAQSPVDRSDRYLAGPVSAVELQTFLTQIGAWSSAFTSVPDNFSEPGMRALGDQIAQNRPGPMLMHNLRLDPDAGALAAGYHFLYGSTPEAPPCSPALFIYCQPYLSADAVPEHAYVPPTGPGEAVAKGLLPRGEPAFAELARNVMQEAQAARSHEPSPLDPLFGGENDVSSWVASTERFAEQVQLRYQELARDNLLPEQMRERQTRLAMETIDRLRKAVANEFGKEPGNGGTP
jgi:hypothetical protein